MVVEFILRGLKTEIDTDAIISMLKAGNDIENEYIIGVIQELVAKCEALEPLNISILDLLSITDKQFKEIKRLEAELEQLKEENEKVKSNTYAIDWELFATGKIAVECETKTEIVSFLKEVEARGYSILQDIYDVLRHGEGSVCFRHVYTPYTNYKVIYSSKEYYESKGIKVVKWKPDEAEVLYDALTEVEEKYTENTKKLIDKVKEQSETIISYKTQCEELRKTCNKLRVENASIKNDKSELILAIKNTRYDIKMTADYLDSIVNAFHGDNKFDWDRFKTANIAVHCRTLDEAIDFIKSAKDHVKIWYGGDKIDEECTYWETHGREMCYAYKNAGLIISTREISHNCDREILEWSNYMVKDDE